MQIISAATSTAYRVSESVVWPAAADVVVVVVAAAAAVAVTSAAAVATFVAVVTAVVVTDRLRNQLSSSSLTHCSTATGKKDVHRAYRTAQIIAHHCMSTRGWDAGWLQPSPSSLLPHSLSPSLPSSGCHDNAPREWVGHRHVGPSWPGQLGAECVESGKRLAVQPLPGVVEWRREGCGGHA